MGGGLVAGLPHSRGHHPAVCHPLLVPASFFAAGPREGHTGAEKKRSPSAETQVSRRREQFHRDGQRWEQMDGWRNGCMDGWMDRCVDGCMDICLQPLRVFFRSVPNQALCLQISFPLWGLCWATKCIWSTCVWRSSSWTPSLAWSPTSPSTLSSTSDSRPRRPTFWWVCLKLPKRHFSVRLLLLPEKFRLLHSQRGFLALGQFK